MRLPSLMVFSLLLAWPRAARADASPTDDAYPKRTVPRLTVAGAAGYAFLHRSTTDPSSRDGVVMGAQLRHQPTSSPHGFAATFLRAEGIFGPRVTIFDAAWSYRFIGGGPLGDASGAGYFELGPAFAFVSGAPPAPDHRVLGARASVSFDGYLGPVLLGVTLGYHGGVPLGGPRDAWEGAATSLLRLGLAFDL